MIIDIKSFRFKCSSPLDSVVRSKFAYSNVYLSLSRRTLSSHVRYCVGRFEQGPVMRTGTVGTFRTLKMRPE